MFYHILDLQRQKIVSVEIKLINISRVTNTYLFLQATVILVRENHRRFQRKLSIYDGV